MNRSIGILLAAGIFLFFQSDLKASIRENQFGAGSAASAMAGAGIADINTSAATYLNPANLARCTNSGFDLGLKYISTQFKQEGSTHAVEQAQSVLAAELGGCLTPVKGLGIGLWTSNGLLQPITVKMKTAHDSIIFSRFSRDLNAPTIMAGVGYGFVPHFSLGLGVSLSMHAHIIQKVYAPLSGTEKRFSAELEARVRPRASIVAGLSLHPWDFLGMGATFRSASFGQVDADAVTQAAAINYDIAPIQVALSESLQYSPRQYAFGVVGKPIPSLKIMADVNYAIWSKHPMPFLLATPDPKSEISKGIPFEPVEQFPFRDVFVPKVGVEWSIADSIPLRAGYSFHPAIMGLPTQRTNVVDGASHSVSVGAGYRSQTDAVAFHTDIFIAGSYMPSNRVQKSAAYGKDRYVFSGFAISTGLSAGLDF